ncbi:SiaB family protein kinase [Desulfovibrio inopinatus]|uniref:SiaB family protein kinase n=1 Tax=Desulfovibrio inopinatus TaxID=102109 RepID=UPI000420C0CF|nr:SiaB family protein kinase [Desulfovibrio inopinatus]
MTQNCITTYPAVLQGLHEFYESLQEEGILFCYSGPTNQGLVEGIGDILRQRMAVEEAGTSEVHGLFAIFIEQMQNILHYSAETTPQTTDQYFDEMRHGVVVVGREREAMRRFFVICGNYIEKSKGQVLAEKINAMRSMNKDELKALYKEMRRQDPTTEDSKGAGLGFLEMARKASCPLDYCIANVSEELSFFSVKAVR